MIPTYNQENYIVRAIESALSQDYPNLEIVIADDNSTDETEAVVTEALRKFNSPLIKYFKNKENIGILKNYKKKFILIIDTLDNWAQDEYVQKYMR